MITIYAGTSDAHRFLSEIVAECFDNKCKIEYYDDNLNRSIDGYLIMFKAHKTLEYKFCMHKNKLTLKRRFANSTDYFEIGDPSKDPVGWLKNQINNDYTDYYDDEKEYTMGIK